MTRRRKAKRTRKPERTWDEAMHRGCCRTALVLWLCQAFGHYARWAGTEEEVRAALVEEARAFCRIHGLPHHWAQENAHPVRWAWRYVHSWVCCKAHRRFGKGKRWVDATPDERGSWWVGWERAQEAVMNALDLNALGAELTNSRRRADAMLRRDHARILHKRGMPKWEIAEVFGCDPRTIQRDLNPKEGGETNAT